MKKRILALVLIMATIFNLAGPVTGLAAEGEEPTKDTRTTVVLHKVQMTGELLDKWISGGNYQNYYELDQTDYKEIFKELGEIEEIKPLKGIYFDLYKEVNGEYVLVKNPPHEGGDKTDADGKLIFKDLEDGRYKFVENLEKSDVEGISQMHLQDIVVDLPYYNEDDGTLRKEINIYPKNVLIDSTVNKQVKDRVSDEYKYSETFGYEEENNWKIDVKLPKEAKNMELLRIRDRIPKGLSYLGNEGQETSNIEVYKGITNDEGEQIGELEAVSPENYHIEINDMAEGKEMSITFKDTFIAGLNENQNIVVKLKTKIDKEVINDQVVMDQTVLGKKLKNMAYFDYKEKPKDENDNNNQIKTVSPSTIPWIITGGISFKKIDFEDDKKLLAGAEFKIYSRKVVEGKEILEYVKLDDGSFSFTNEEKDATVFISKENGNFEAYGLPFTELGNTKHDYYLKEIKAPAGYSLPSKDILITINEKSHMIDERLPVSNNKVTIPQTGGSGNKILYMFGVLCMAAAVLVYVEKNKGARKVS